MRKLRSKASLGALRALPLALLFVPTCFLGCGAASGASADPQTSSPTAVVTPELDAASEQPQSSDLAQSSGEPQSAQAPEDSVAKTAPPAKEASAARGVESGSAEEPSESAPPAASDSETTPEPLPLPKGTTVLHVGDSFAGALGIALNKQLKAAGVRGILRYETASYIPNWAWGKKLPLYIAQFKPDLVLVTLGANELEITEPERRIKAIKQIVKRIGDRPCIWVATPLWKGELNGLMDIIRDNIAPCHYMDTNALIPDMKRARDKIHPSMQAREDWAKVVAEWLAAHRHPTEERPWEIASD